MRKLRILIFLVCVLVMIPSFCSCNNHPKLAFSDSLEATVKESHDTVVALTARRSFGPNAELEITLLTEPDRDSCMDLFRFIIDELINNDSIYSQLVKDRSDVEIVFRGKNGNEEKQLRISSSATSNLEKWTGDFGEYKKSAAKKTQGIIQINENVVIETEFAETSASKTVIIPLFETFEKLGFIVLRNEKEITVQNGKSVLQFEVGTSKYTYNDISYYADLNNRAISASNDSAPPCYYYVSVENNEICVDHELFADLLYVLNVNDYSIDVNYNQYSASLSAHIENS